MSPVKEIDSRYRSRSPSSRRRSSMPQLMNVEYNNLKVTLFDYDMPKSEPICVLCLRDSNNSTNQIINCEGQCGHTFHTECIAILLNDLISTDQSLKVNPNYKKCVDCNRNHRRCFQCCKLTDTKADIDIVRCSINGCLRHYHSRCLEDGIYRKKYTIRYVNEDQYMTCPSHKCYSCQFENPFNVRRAESYVRCVMCPTSFHRGEWCIPAGSKEINSSYIVCPQHLHGGGNFDKWTAPFTDCVKNDRVDFGENCHVRPFSLDFRDVWIVDKPEIKNEALPTNVTWCVRCSKGGQLICCGKCPASFHLSCSKISKVPENYVCPTCDLGKFPRYGEVLWVKCGGFRWWPAQVIHPRNATEAALRSTHMEGQFLVLFFGTNDYFWTNKTHAFAFNEGDDKESPSKGEQDGCIHGERIKEQYRRGLKDAGQTYRDRSITWLNLVRAGDGPVLYRKIPLNIEFGHSSLKEKEINKCGCKYWDNYYPCGYTSGCSNASEKRECNPRHCINRDMCCNQRFMKQEYPDHEVFRTNDRGWGYRLLQSAVKGVFINEYVGNIIYEVDANRRLKESITNNVTNIYMVKYNEGRVIDASIYGNDSRFINHSCSPNLTIEKWNVNGNTRVGLFALRNIDAREELTFDYNSSSFGENKLACRCGAGNCSGFIGVRPIVAVDNIIRDLECFLCRKRNCDLSCSLEHCPRAFHRACVNGDQSASWNCPCHFCDECGTSAVATCYFCVASYCGRHLDDRLMEIRDDGYVCSEHKALPPVN